MLTPRAVARRLQLAWVGTVHAMIRRNEIPATNRLEGAPSGRARYLIDEDDLEAFLKRRKRPKPRPPSQGDTEVAAAL